MSAVTTPLPFYCTSSPLLPFLTHVFSLSPTVHSASHAPHLHSDRSPLAPHDALPYSHDPVPYSHVSTGSCASSTASHFDIFIPLLSMQLVPCGNIYSIIDQAQFFRISRNHICHLLHVSNPHYMHCERFFLLLYSCHSFLPLWSR